MVPKECDVPTPCIFGNDFLGSPCVMHINISVGSIQTVAS